MAFQWADVAPLAPAAREAQDRIGWQDYTDHAGMASALVELARVVVQLAGTVDRLVAERVQS